MTTLPPTQAPDEVVVAVDWQTAAIGYDAPPETLQLSSAGDDLVLRGGGADIWYDRDAFLFAYVELEGDGALEVRLADLAPVHDWSKAGVMIREDLAPDARNVLLHTTASMGSVLQARETAGGMTNNRGGHDAQMRPGGWMRLTRSGDQIIGELSADGNAWTELGRYALDLDATVLIGLAVTSHTDGALATARFTEPRLHRRGPPADRQPQPEPDPEPEPESPWAGVPRDYPLPAATLFVSPTGSDSNSGRSVDAPLRTITRAASLVQPGDVVYLRGGVYPIQVAFRRSGTADAPIVWASYPGEWAILDGSDQEDYVSTQRMWVDGVSWNVFVNFEVRNGPRQGVYVRDSSDNVFHGIVTHGHHGSGVANLNSHRNRYEYIVTYDNFDVYHPEGESGQDADGIGISSGDGNVLYRVVSFYNSDDGIDAWLSTNTVIQESVSFLNGRGSHGNGNGVKAGGGGAANHTIVRGSIAFDNRGSGFTYNSGNYVSFLNNTAYGNGGPEFVAASTTVLRNNIAIGGRLSIGGADTRANTWDLGMTDVRAISLDPAHDGFLALGADSPAIDAGTDVGMPYAGTAPDLGALPYQTTLADLIDPSLVDIGDTVASLAGATIASARY